MKVCRHCGERDQSRFTKSVASSCNRCRSVSSREHAMLEFKEPLRIQNDFLKKYWSKGRQDGQKRYYE